MRKDVKLGMVLALVAVLVAGWYYSRDKEAQQPILLGDAEPAAELDQAPAVEVVTADPEPASDTAVAQAEPPVGNAIGSESAELAMADPVQPGSPTSPDDNEAGLLTAQRGTSPPRTAAAPDDAAADDAGAPVFDLASVFGIEEPASEADPAPVGTDREAPATTVVRPATPAATASAEPAPARDVAGEAAVEQYTVQPGDTLAVLAEIYYGSQRHLHVLVEANPQLKNPDNLRAGSVIRIPPAPQAVAAKTQAAAKAPAQPAAADGYVVKPGDSFYRIAANKLGAGSRWKEVFELNKAVVHDDPTALKPGMVLQLPKK